MVEKKKEKGKRGSSVWCDVAYNAKWVEFCLELIFSLAAEFPKPCNGYVPCEVHVTKVSVIQSVQNNNNNNDNNSNKGQSNLAIGSIAANWRFRPPNLSFPPGGRGPCLIQSNLGPHECSCKWHLIPSNGFSSARMWQTTHRQITR